MNTISTNIEDVKIIIPDIFLDDRGYFFESYNETKYNKLLIKNKWIQDNESRSKINTLRGLHYQIPPYTQAKLVRVIKGKVLDVAVDIRSDSPTFGKHVSVILSDENKYQFYIPRGFAHGFITLEDDTIFSYKCDNVYNKESERGILFNDSFLNINWLYNKFEDLILSEKDLLHPLLKDINYFTTKEFNQ